MGYGLWAMGYGLWVIGKGDGQKGKERLGDEQKGK